MLRDLVVLVKVGIGQNIYLLRCRQALQLHGNLVVPGKVGPRKTDVWVSPKTIPSGICVRRNAGLPWRCRPPAALLSLPADFLVCPNKPGER